MLRVAAAGGLLLLSGCSLLLADDLNQDAVDDERVDGAAESGAAPSSDGGSGDSGDLVDVDASTTSRRPFGPLVAVETGSSISARVDGFFHLEYTSARGWKPAQVRDLGLAGTPNLVSAFEPLFAVIEGKTVASSSDENTGYYQVVDETPVRFLFTTYAHHVLPSGADAKVWTHWAIYPTGRVVARLEVSNPGTADLALPQGWLHSSITVDETKPWKVVDSADGRGATFYHQKPSGLGLTTLLQEPSPKLGARSAAEHHWSEDQHTMPTGAVLTRVNELHLGVTPEEAFARIADARSPGLVALSNIVPVDLGYDIAKATYRLRATGGSPIKFELKPNLARAYPAFEIDDLAAPSGWRLLLDGQTVASSTAPVTPLGVARHTPSTGKLLVVYFGTIPMNAPAEKRTFVLEPL